MYGGKGEESDARVQTKKTKISFLGTVAEHAVAVPIQCIEGQVCPPASFVLFGSCPERIHLSLVYSQ